VPAQAPAERPLALIREDPRVQMQKLERKRRPVESPLKRRKRSMTDAHMGLAQETSVPERLAPPMPLQNPTHAPSSRTTHLEARPRIVISPMEYAEEACTHMNRPTNLKC
jgi:hypothetical protein